MIKNTSHLYLLRKHCRKINLTITCRFSTEMTST